MSNDLWQAVKNELEAHAYMSGVEREQSRIRETAEVFTPTNLIIEIFSYLDLSLFGPGKTVFDPACGDGQFLVAAKAVKVHGFGMDETEALSELYGVDIMPDNVSVCRSRLGGGNIFVGDALNPRSRVEGQSDYDYHCVNELLSSNLPGMAAKPKPQPRRAADLSIIPLF